MKKIGLLSDTHGWLNPAVFEFFKDCDEIWHVGDIGSTDVADALMAFKPLRAVYGNVDVQDVRLMFPKVNIFTIENVKVMMTHIGGYPGHYESGIKELIIKEKPNIFISGHSHILKVIYDKKLDLLHVNPGAAGNSGFHKQITFIRMAIDGKTFKDMEIFQLDRNKVI